LPGTTPIIGPAYDTATNSPTAVGQPLVNAQPEIQNIFATLHNQIDDNGKILERQPAAAQAQQQPNNPPTLAQHFANTTNVTDFDVYNTVQQMGGWQNPALRDDAVVSIFNSRSGNLKNEAQVELRRRGLIP
jgi:hypothetical protein